MPGQLETAKQLLALPGRYLDRGDAVKAAHALEQGEQIVVELASKQAQTQPRQH